MTLSPSSAAAPHGRTGLLLGLVGVVIFGLTLPMSRLAVLELDPVFVVLARALIAALLSVIYLIVSGAPKPERADWPRLLAFSLCVVFLFPLLMTIAMRYAPSAHGGIVLGVLPLLTAMASVAVAGERPSLGFWLCGIAGTAAVVAYAMLSSAGAADIHWADLLLAFAAVSAALGYALGGELTRRIGGAAVISWALVVAVPALLGLWLILQPPVHASAGLSAWCGLAYVAVFSQFLGFFAWNRGLALGGIAKVGQTQLLQTFVTLAGAAVILGERIGLMEWGFAALVMAIVALGWRMRVVRSSQAE